MKLMKRAGIYKANNVTFNPATKFAESYNWWAFVSVIQNKVVFNEYRYSVSTSKHQHKVQRLMNELGIKIDLVVKTRSSLHTVQSLKEVKLLNELNNELLAAKKESQRIERNARAKRKRAEEKETALRNAMKVVE